MILTAHQPTYLPWLGLFDKIAGADCFVFFNQVQYVKKDWINRNLIKSPQGPVWLTVPAITSGRQFQRISEVRIDQSRTWQENHWRTIEFCYRRAAHFDEVAELLKPVYLRKTWDFLFDLNQTLIFLLLGYLGIEVKILDARDFDWKGAKSELVLSMCRSLGASKYVFGALGKQYADLDSFMSAGVDVVFQDYLHPIYPQLWGDFQPNLSVIDLLFNCGPDSLEVLTGLGSPS